MTRLAWLLLLVLASVQPVAADEVELAEWTYLQRSDDPTASDLPIVVQGVVIDGEAGGPLSYTNIFVEDTDFGTMALTEGRFWLRGLSAGRYTLKARYLGFEEGVAEIEVRPGDVIDLRFVLELEPVVFDAFDVRAQRQLVILQETGTARRISADDIENLALDDVEEIVGLQAGVVINDNAIHVRGGRADDTQFYVDGVSVNDPLSAGRYGANFNEDLISEIEVLTGGFSAEYGQAVSGVVRVSTKEGGRDFEGKVTYRTDSVAPEEVDYDTDEVRLTLSGPNLLWDGLKRSGLKLPGEQTWIASVSGDFTNTYLPTSTLTGPLQSGEIGSDWAPRAENEYSALGKLTWKFAAERKLNLTYNYQQSISQGFFLPAEGWPNSFRNILDDYDVFYLQSIQTQANWKHVLGEDSFYEITLGRQFSRQNSHKNGESDFTTYRIDNVRPENTNPEAGVTWTEGVWEQGEAKRWHDHFADIYSIKADWAWVGDENNKFKTGFDYSFSDVQLGDYSDGFAEPGRVAINEDVFVVQPHTVAAYVQDRISYKGLILNIGMRYDAWAPGRQVDNVMSSPEEFLFITEEDAQNYDDKTVEFAGLNWKQRLSPRVGFSFPISERDKFFFNYGHFSQWPRWNYVYSQLDVRTPSQSIPLLGNPDLDPKVTVQYETGIQREFEGQWSAGLTFFSNDIFDYAQSVGLSGVTIDPEDTPDPNDSQPVTIAPVRYFNADAARSIGIELTIEKRATSFTSGSFALELSRATGTNSDANRGFLSAVLESGAQTPVQTENLRPTPLVWDRPWSITTSFNIFADADDSPNYFGWQTPRNWNLNLLYRAWAGQRYTRLTFDPEDGSTVPSIDRNAEIGPYRSSFDVKLRRWWNLPGAQKVTMFLEAQNVFDHGNFRRINPWTGEPYYRGNWDATVASQINNLGLVGSSPAPDVFRDPYVDARVDPSHRTNPRRFLMGVSWEW